MKSKNGVPLICMHLAFHSFICMIEMSLQVTLLNAEKADGHQRACDGQFVQWLRNQEAAVGLV